MIIFLIIVAATIILYLIDEKKSDKSYRYSLDETPPVSEDEEV